MATLSLVPPMIDTADPDIALIHSKVAEAVGADTGTAPRSAEAAAPAAPAAPAKKKKEPAEASAVTGGSLGTLSQGYAANEATDLGAAC